MTKIQETFHPPDTGAKLLRMDREMTYHKNNNIDEAIHQKLRKKDWYETDMHNIYNLIVGQTNDILKDNAESDATFQAFKSGRYPLGTC